jgi:hypothetical protein
MVAPLVAPLVRTLVGPLVPAVVTPFFAPFSAADVVAVVQVPGWTPSVDARRGLRAFQVPHWFTRRPMSL